MSDPREEIRQILQDHFPASVEDAVVTLVEIVCPFMVTVSVSSADARANLHELIDDWFALYGAEADAHFTHVQPKAE